MNVYVRRRLVAIGGAVAVLAVPAYLILAGTSGSHSTAAVSGPISASLTVPSPPPRAQGQLAAVLPHGTLPLPTHTVGAGPFVTVSGTAIHRLEGAHRAGAVALTFDDGPGPLTEQILERLVRLHAPATFFVLGVLANRHPEVLRDERAAGMVVANHTWAHPGMTNLSASAQRWQLHQTSKTVQRIIGTAPRFFRPPMWMWDATTAREAAQQGMVTVLFSVDTLDYTRPGVQAIVHAAVHAPAGSVIALHDAGGDRSQTLRALPLIVRGLRARGLKLVTLDQLYAGRP